MSDERVSISVVREIADVRLNRPDKLNAIDAAMVTALSEASATVAGWADVRVVLLSGSERGFCAGLDLASLAEGAPPTSIQERTHGVANLWQYAVWAGGNWPCR